MNKYLVFVYQTVAFVTGSLGNFLHTAQSLSIPLVRGGSGVPIPDQLARFGMTAKKCHEVASFSQYVAQLTSGKDINQVKSISIL